MDIFASAERLMTMDETVWKRHANPWSGWTRFLTVMPLMSLAIWSRAWLGGYSLLPIGLSLFWAWYNPRAFPVPKSTQGWMAKGTFGERIFIKERKTKIAAHHLRMANFLTLLSFIGSLIWIYGLWTLNFWAVVAGIVSIVLPKAWFVDRMVWIYEEMKDTDPVYASWLR